MAATELVGDAQQIVHSTYEWLQILSLGALAGAIGQGGRTAIGIKKLNDAATGDISVGDLIVISRMVVSFLIGTVAGALASYTMIIDIAHVSSQQIFALVAAGYAGTDVIEGLINRSTGSADAPAGSAAVGVGDSAPEAGAAGAVG
jgi:hypothetical protein